MKKILCVGEILIDFLPGEESGIYIRKPGGAPANVAVAAARSSIDASFCGRVGDDDFGHFLLGVLEENRVTPLCPNPVKEATTTMAFVSLDETGNRSFTFARKPGADMFLTRPDVDAALKTQPALLHAGSCSLSENPAADATVYAMAQAKKQGALVSFDVNYRNLMWGDDRAAAAAAIQSVLPLVDYLKISEEEEDLLGMPVAQAMEAHNISVAVKTLGNKGAVCYWNGSSLSVAGRKAVCVDTTGAGDAFWGAFLAYLLRQNVTSASNLNTELLQKALDYGNVAGWLCVQRKGAMEALPTTAEIEAILQA